jgi:A1 cistron-splicing factor AAR2
MTLKHQLEHFDCTVLQEEDYSNGNVLVPAIQKICFICKTLGEDNDNMLKNANALVDLVKQRFNMQSDMQVMQMESNASPPTNDNDNLKNIGNLEMHDSDDDDGPVIIGLEEYQASMERNATIEKSLILTDESITDMNKYKNDYPFLCAAMESGEDILMACARILDEKKDVTLVREAANFLENIERCR